MNTHTDNHHVYLERLVLRLCHLFVDKKPLPGSNMPMTLQQLQRLYKHVINEGYGE